MEQLRREREIEIKRIKIDQEKEVERLSKEQETQEKMNSFKIEEMKQKIKMDKLHT